METKDLLKYDQLSPFEVKDKLIELAKSHHERMMLDAGRGNPNWVATTPRRGYFQLGLFALSEAERSFTDMAHFGGYTQAEGLKARFDQFIRDHAGTAGIEFLQKAVAYAEQHLGIPTADLLLEFSDGIIGNHYPVPDRMLKHCETICAAYIRKEFGAGRPFDRPFDLFATEGGTAAMTYVFQTLKENKLLNKGDTIAIGVPIFTPYIEIPRLNDYKFVEVEVTASEDERWQIPESEIDKLLDPKVKAFFVTNPSNPPSVKIQDATIDRIVEIVRALFRFSPPCPKIPSAFIPIPNTSGPRGGGWVSSPFVKAMCWTRCSRSCPRRTKMSWPSVIPASPWSRKTLR
jgi:aspartate 4-decarboxylase